MPKSDPANTVLSLLSREQRKSGRSILLTGPWGCGKTFLWKQKISPALGRPHIYVSAFGADSAAALKGRLVAHLALGLLGRGPSAAGNVIDKVAPGVLENAGRSLLEATAGVRGLFGRPAKMVLSSLSSVGAGLLRRADIDPVELADLLDASTVICIDDVERAALPPTELLGIVNILSEHKALDVVMICNEEQLIAGAHGEMYGQHKEKAISFAVQVSGDPAALFDRLVEATVGTKEATRGRIANARPAILEVFARTHIQNLRTLARILTHIDVLTAEGIRELDQVEVRFLAALCAHLAGAERTSDEFYRFDPVVVRVSHALLAMKSKQAPDPTRESQRKFLDEYFGEAEYRCHEGILEFVRRGVLDPDKFDLRRPDEPSGFSKTMATVAGGEWRYWSDAAVRELVAALAGHIEARDPPNARQEIQCLAYARMLASFLNDVLGESTTLAARSALSEMAARLDTLGPHFEVVFAELQQYVSEDLKMFLEECDKAKANQLRKSITGLVDAGDRAGLADHFQTLDPAALEILFDNLEGSRLLALEAKDPQTLAIVVPILVKESQKSAGMWPDGMERLRVLRATLQQVVDDSNQQKMTRWRARSLLRDFPVSMTEQRPLPDEKSSRRPDESDSAPSG